MVKSPAKNKSYRTPKRRKKKNNTSYTKYPIMIIVAIALIFIGYKTYCFISNNVHNEGFDERWPFHDETSGSYSGGYDGIDISHHQGRIVWSELRNVKRVKFIYVKATEGTSIVDPWYSRYVDSARALKIPVGAYHFMSKKSAVLQFENFRSHVDKDKQDLLPVIDVEDDGTKGMDKDDIQKTLKSLCNLMEKYYGEKPIIYCSEEYYNSNLSPVFDNYILWIAKYSYSEPVLKGAPHYAIWQHHRHGRVPGILNWTDLNSFASDKDVEDISLKK